MEQEHLEMHRSLVEGWLNFPYWTGDRALYLSDHTNVLRDLTILDPEDWSLCQAALVHLDYTSLYPNETSEAIFQLFRDEAQGCLYDLTLDTMHDRPSPRERKPRELWIDHEITCREATYCYSRLALAVLVGNDEPNQAIELLESVGQLFQPHITYRLPGSRQHTIHPALQFLRRLPILYERVERYEDALSHTWSTGEYSVHDTAGYQGGIRRFNGWLGQLSGQAGIAEVKRFLDLIYEWLDAAREVDNEDRDHLSECPIYTRQHWAWYYGYVLGQLITGKPSLRATLLNEVDSGQWENGWHIAGILFETPPQSWDAYRKLAFDFYDSSDIEGYSEHGTISWNASQLPHMSAQSDLYWAMRVGFADVQLENPEDRLVSLNSISDTLEQIKTIASRTALEVLRTERSIGDLTETVETRVLPNDGYFRELLQKDLPKLVDKLPGSTVEHLIETSRQKFAKQPDASRIALCKSVESLFNQVLHPKIQELAESKGLRLVVPRASKSPRRFSLGKWHMVSISGWARILDTACGDNVDLRSILPSAFPNADIDAVVNLKVGLKRIAQLRGSSSHDSKTSYDQKSNDAQELWDVVVGNAGTGGFITKFYSALGLMENG